MPQLAIVSADNTASGPSPSLSAIVPAAFSGPVLCTGSVSSHPAICLLHASASASSVSDTPYLAAVLSLPVGLWDFRPRVSRLTPTFDFQSMRGAPPPPLAVEAWLM